jgi:hypothetical protein
MQFGYKRLTKSLPHQWTCVVATDHYTVCPTHHMGGHAGDVKPGGKATDAPN